MSEESIHDEVLGCVVKDVVRGLWIAHVPVLPDHPIEVRLIGGLAKALPTAKKLIPSLGENESRARLYAAEQLLDLHNEVFSEEELLTEGDFVDRLHLDSAALFDRGCMLCFKDRRNAWEHGVNVLIGSDGGLVRADTAPTLFRPESRIHVEPFPPLTLAMGFGLERSDSILGAAFSRDLVAMGR